MAYDWVVLCPDAVAHFVQRLKNEIRLLARLLLGTGKLDNREEELLWLPIEQGGAGLADRGRGIKNRRAGIRRGRRGAGRAGGAAPCT